MEILFALYSTFGFFTSEAHLIFTC